MKTVFIHGAFSSPISFNYIRSKLLLTDELLIEYKVEDGLEFNVAKIKNIILDSCGDQPVNIISHSMGGLISTMLYHENIKINKLVSMSAPLGGSKFAEYARWWTKNQLLADLSNRKLYDSLKSKKIKCDNLFIITTKGYTNSYGIKNDCVVSVDSQCNIIGLNYKEFEFTHTEVLMSNEIVKEIDNFIN